MPEGGCKAGSHGNEQRSSMGNAPRLQAPICRIGDKGVLSHDDCQSCHLPVAPYVFCAPSST